MIRFAYLCILLFIIIFTFILINKSIKMCPSKIKVFYMFSFILVVLKDDFVLKCAKRIINKTKNDNGEK